MLHAVYLRTRSILKKSSLSSVCRRGDKIILSVNSKYFHVLNNIFLSYLPKIFYSMILYGNILRFEIKTIDFIREFNYVALFITVPLKQENRDKLYLFFVSYNYRILARISFLIHRFFHLTT